MASAGGGIQVVSASRRSRSALARSLGPRCRRGDYDSGSSDSGGAHAPACAPPGVPGRFPLPGALRARARLARSSRARAEPCQPDGRHERAVLRASFAPGRRADDGPIARQDGRSRFFLLERRRERGERGTSSFSRFLLLLLLRCSPRLALPSLCASRFSLAGRSPVDRGQDFVPIDRAAAWAAALTHRRPHAPAPARRRKPNGGKGYGNSSTRRLAGADVTNCDYMPCADLAAVADRGIRKNHRSTSKNCRSDRLYP